MLKKPQLQDFTPANLTVSQKQLHHVFNEADCYALWAAYAAGRPLLVRGKPGTGKSQMAKAIAAHLGWTFVSEVVRGSTELSDLHWHFDAIGRLGEAQAMNNSDYAKQAKAKAGNSSPLDPLNYLSPGAFWWAYDWPSAALQYQRCTTRLRPQPALNGADASKGVVLLLDEIDKAEPDLPNGLLETLGHYQFTVPYIDHLDQSAQLLNPISADPSKLLIVITTNEERELPSAFVRRCFVHTLMMENSTETLDNGLQKRYHWLIARGKLHFGLQIAEPVYLQAAELLWQDRAQSLQSRYPPGLAEYIDLLNALKELSHTEQEDRLNKIAAYALNKTVAD